jgi:uncharacterized membrane protein required for colicin V production
VDANDELARANAKFSGTPTVWFVINVVVLAGIVVLAFITDRAVGFSLGILTAYVGLEFRNFWIRRNARTFAEKSARSELR